MWMAQDHRWWERAEMTQGMSKTGWSQAAFVDRSVVELKDRINRAKSIFTIEEWRWGWSPCVWLKRSSRKDEGGKGNRFMPVISRFSPSPDHPLSSCSVQGSTFVQVIAKYSRTCSPQVPRSRSEEEDKWDQGIYSSGFHVLRLFGAWSVQYHSFYQGSLI